MPDDTSVAVKRESNSFPHDNLNVGIKREGDFVDCKPLKTRPIFPKPTQSPDDEENTSDTGAPIEIQKPNFEPSGLLAAETNQKNGIALKYTVPPESKLPKVSWRLYVFKPMESEEKRMDPIKTIHLDCREYYLIGKDRRVVDVDLHHPSISKQHAVIQHRQVQNNRIFERDIIKFGQSTREYILLNDQCLEASDNSPE
ncbi:bifunctional SMAD-FHA domain superfamily/Forkhead-associated (FHA) domain [Babesia duncani]|uniref:Bifunctional SMAD-FHA domain superfamily/Forkhead-associated (FHA) domain n=1 Tax=Babesia duncani TaxID=323732 RepID=A0AAD9PHZ9_9APIC|nr:bifunctional SMAD-FHA domain superfamily/Forkhead-associated (FHA) domain [Babesia duncani]